MSEQTPSPLNQFREIPASPVKKREKRQKPEQEKTDVHEEAMTRFKQIVSREEESRILGIEDLIFIDQDGGSYDVDTGFLSGDQRTNDSLGSDEPPAPRYQIDRISPVIEQAVSDQRESQVNIQVRATGEVESGINDTFNGLIKNVESVSDAQDSYDGGFDECQKSGYGGWRIITQFSDDSFEQDIRIEPIKNATQSLFFGPAKKATKEDALYAYYIWWMDLDEFKVQFPGAEGVDWPTENLNTFSRAWFNSNDNMIRVAEYWRKRPVEREIVQLADGNVIGTEDFVEGMQIAIGTDGQPKTRKVKTYQVERFIMTGTEVVEGPSPWAGKFIPLIPEYGITSVIDGREIIRGRVRKGKDAARIYNYTTSAIVQAGAQAGKDFHWMTPAQAEGHVTELENMNIDQNPVYLFNPDPESPGAPQKAQGPTIQQALIAQAAQAREDISASVGSGIGVQDGTAGDPRSGEAIREGNVNSEKGNSIYLSNHHRSVTYTGIQLADLMSKLWTTERQERIIKPDGEEDFVTINQTVTKTNPETGEIETIIVNDLGQASFDVVLDVGPAYASQRQQGADQLTKLSTENQAFATETPDLIAKNLDIPGSKELEKRLRRKGIQNGTIEPTDEEREEFKIDERQQLTEQLTPQIREEVTQEANIQLIQANAAKLNAEAGNLQAATVEKQTSAGKASAETEQILEETEGMKMDALLKAIEANSKLQESMLEKLLAGIQPSQIEIDNLNKQDNIIEDVQQDTSPGPSTALQEEFDQKAEENPI